MEQILKELVENGEQLKKLSQEEIDPQTIASLQQQQKQLLEQLSTPIPQHLRPFVHQLQECNNTLITNLTIRRELIKQELYETKKSRQALQGFKNVYTPIKKQRQRVDTTS